MVAMSGGFSAPEDDCPRKPSIDTMANSKEAVRMNFMAVLPV
jgi:hypothetical protein